MLGICKKGVAILTKHDPPMTSSQIVSAPHTPAVHDRFVSILLEYPQVHSPSNHLKPFLPQRVRNIAGVKSEGIILCAMDRSRRSVQIIEPPVGSVIGERVYFGEEKFQASPLKPLTLNKRKLWPRILAGLETGADGRVLYDGAAMRTSAGLVVVAKVPYGIVTALWGRDIHPGAGNGGDAGSQEK